jgi:hypothetical protein
MRATGVDSESAETVHWRGRTRRGVDGVLGDGHGDIWVVFGAKVWKVERREFKL